ncbi:BON domain-containing protein [Actinokineospora bangkokensis]|uniref:Phospholipid-binding protein n=1 Tax=Actinokineospora bangkokensis TaxID=1193682 RepID=A0A1Q9LMQ7_9PSEU|nr:BON domain-containing protein [Actinokineospora bangkokensis]OLR93310.1 phospholipid-binding protein [Actinokineospora bangkokensis]
MSEQVPRDDSPQYLVARLRRALAEDPRTAEMGVRVHVNADRVHLSGEVATAQRRSDLDAVLADEAPGLQVHNDVRVSDTREPAHREELR